MKMEIERKTIDWEATGAKLFRLRSDNPHLRRYVCSVTKYGTDKCLGNGDCANCIDKHMDRNISRPELAKVFHTTDDVIANWEMKGQPVPLDELLFYCKIARVNLEDILVFFPTKK